MMVQITQEEKEVLRKEWETVRVRYIVYDSKEKAVKCYSENSRFLYSTRKGPVFEIAKKLPKDEIMYLIQLID